MVAAFEIGIVVTFMLVVVQSGGINCPDGCQIIRKSKETTSLIIVKNVSDAHDSSDCVPINTTLFYVCKDRETDQINPWFKPEDLFRTCTRSGLLNGKGYSSIITDSPYCVTRQEHCRSLPATINPNVLVQIDGQNINVDKNNMTSVYYSVGTTVTYKCKDSKSNAKDSQRLWRCNNNGFWGVKILIPKYEWKPNDPNGKDLVCDNLPGEILVNDDDRVSPVPSFTVSNIFSNETQTDHIETRPPSDNSNKHTPTPFLSPPKGNDNVVKEPSTTNASFKNVNPRNEPQEDHVLIGIFSSLGIVVLIAVLFGVLHKKRARRSKRCKDIADHVRQITFTSTPEEKNKLEQNFADGEEETLQYVNIIPIAVNQEIIYTEVETGKIACNNSGPTVKRNIDDDSTVYAEIHDPHPPQ